MNKGLKLLILSTVVSGVMVACKEDSDTDTQQDASMMSTVKVPTSAPAPSVAGGTIDLACRGTRTAPANTGTEAAFTLHVQDFFTKAPVASAPVKFFKTNVIPADLTGGQEMTTDPSGNVTVMAVPGSWYAYQVGAISTTVPTLQINETAPAAAATANATSVSQSTTGLINTLLVRTRVPGTAMVAGTVYDCNDAPVQGAVVRMYRTDGTYIEPGTLRTDPLYAYFTGSAPDTTREYSNDNGLYGAANIPITGAGEVVRVETWARVAGAEQMVGCEKVQMFADSVAIVNVGPKRSDGPTDCSE